MGAAVRDHPNAVRDRSESLSALKSEQVSAIVGIRNLTHDAIRRVFLFEEGQTVREVAAVLRISKSEAGRLRQRAVEEGLVDRDRGLDSVIRLVPPSQTLGEQRWDSRIRLRTRLVQRDQPAASGGKRSA